MKITQSIKNLLISFLVSLNVCLWKDILGDIFCKAALIIIAYIIGLLIYGEVFHGRKKGRGL